MMTPELLLQVLPKNLRGCATQEFADKVNGIVSDPEVAEMVKENFISYSKVLADGKFKTEDYLAAVTYVSYKVMGYNNTDAYARTFPDRWKRHALLGTSSKDLSAYVSAYNKGKLVNLILEQSLIPSWILNQDAYQKAINVQLELMTGAHSEKVRSDAANSILTHLKPPEVKKVELDVTLKDNSGMADLRATMAEMARTQLDLIEAGQSARTVARTPLRLGSDDDVIDVPHQVISQGQALPAPVTLPDPVNAAPARRPSLFDPVE